MTRHSGLRLVGIAATVLVATPAAAASYIGSAQVGTTVVGGTTPDPQRYALGSGSDFGSVVLSSAGGGSVLARGSAKDSSTGLGRGFVSYTIRLTGPGGGPVPVTVVANGYADGTGFVPVTNERLYQASASFTLYAETPITIDANTSRGNGRQTFALNTVALLMPNTDYSVGLFASAGGSCYRGIVNSAEAFVDPSFTVDPAFAALYRIVGVPTAVVPPTTGVPEPASWALLVAGFGLVGATRRRRLTRDDRAFARTPAAS